MRKGGVHGENPRLYTDGLSVGWNGVPILRGVDLKIRAGEVLALLGPNGAGKSTLLRTLFRQLNPLGGAAYLDGRDMAPMDGGELARRLSIVTTDRLGGEALTAEDVVRSGRYPYTGRLGILSARDRAAMESAMARLSVGDLRERPFRQLSDGQRQRVLLARALCQEPEVLLLDEPASFLDLRGQWELLSLLREISREGLAVVLTLHQLDFARRAARTVACIRDGRVDRTGRPEEVLTPEYVERLYGLPAGAYREWMEGRTSVK